MSPSYVRFLHDVAGRHGFTLARRGKHWVWKNSAGTMVTTPTSPSTRENASILEAKFRRAAARS